jgi:hypothetical protein
MHPPRFQMSKIFLATADLQHLARSLPQVKQKKTTAYVTDGWIKRNEEAYSQAIHRVDRVHVEDDPVLSPYPTVQLAWYCSWIQH